MFEYTPKFKDMRIKPPADDVSRAKAAKTKVCEHKSCDLAGEFPAPKREGNGRYHFCKRHAAEYNKSFNYFDGMTEKEVKDFNEAERHGHKQTWKLGSGPAGQRKAASFSDPRKWKGREMFDDGLNTPEKQAARGRSRLQTRALAELDLEPTATPADIRARYADYVRRFHPDSNGGDRSSEEKLNRVIRAWKLLKEAGATKD